MEPEKLDLSVLDPSRDPVKWRKLVDAIAREGVEVRRRRVSFFGQLAKWARPGAALAAATAVIVLFLSAVSTHTHQTASRVSPDPAVAMLAWTYSDHLPDSETVLRVLGGNHERK